MNAIRVILTCNYSPWSAYTGGAQRSTDALADALARRGHRVTVVYTRLPWDSFSVPPTAYEVRWATLTDVRRRGHTVLRVLTAWSVARAVRSLINDHQRTNDNAPLVVHANGEEGALMGILPRPARIGRFVTPRYPALPKLVLTQQDRGWVPRSLIALRYPKYSALGAALRAADVCAPPSQFAAQMVQRAYGLDPARIQPVPNGVPHEFVDRVWRTPRGSSDDRPIFFFGRLADVKGVDTLLDAFARLSSRGFRHVLRIAGQGPRRQDLAIRARALGLANRVEFLDWCGHQQLGAVLEESSIVVLPSREENLSLAVLSAMAVGTPLVTTAVGGTPEVVRNGVSGLLCPRDDASALSEAMRKLLEDAGAAQEMSAAARHHVRTNFTWAAAARRFESLYEATLARRGGRPNGASGSSGSSGPGRRYGR